MFRLFFSPRRILTLLFVASAFSISGCTTEEESTLPWGGHHEAWENNAGIGGMIPQSH